MDDDALERLEMRIDSKDEPAPMVRRPLYSDGVKLKERWVDAPKKAKRTIIPGALQHFSLLELLFAGSIVFFIAAGSIAGLLLFSGNNTVSTRNVTVAVTGPTSVRAGEEVTMQVVISNRNAVPMNLTDMLIEFPSGTRSPLDVSIDLPRSRESLGTIQPGASVNRSVKAVMFGQAGVPIVVKVTAEYRVPSSNAVFQSNSEYHATISQSPAAITVEALKEVVSGQPTEFKVSVTSNASENLTGMLLVANYPPGFQFISATPAAYSGTSVWDLGDIEPRGVRTVTVQGTFTGEDGENRVLHFTSGTKKKGDQSSISAPLAATDTTLVVAKPFVSVALALDGNTSGSINVTRGQQVQGEVRWSNNLPVGVQNLEIELKLNGAILDRNSVKASRGFYRSADSTIVFSKDTDPSFAVVEPGDTGVTSFQFAALPLGRGSFQSPQITLTATVKANRAAEGGVTSIVTSSAQANVQVSTDLALTATQVHVSGPIPPKVDTETGYSVTWSVTNSANAIANATVSAVLPPYVTWKSATSPDVTYNENGRTVTWTIGDMTANAGRTATFVVGLTPSVSQISNPAAILTNQRVTAFDRFIRAAVERTADPLTTVTGVPSQQGVVVP